MNRNELLDGLLKFQNINNTYQMLESVNNEKLFIEILIASIDIKIQEWENMNYDIIRKRLEFLKLIKGKLESAKDLLIFS